MDQNAYREFIEISGDMMNEHGLPHMAGRIVGALLVCDPPHRSMDELAEDLQASKGSISMATQLLTRIGCIERISLPGARRHYYRIRSELWEELLNARTEHLLMHQRTLVAGMQLLKDAPVESKARLLEFQAFIDFVSEELPALSERWEQRRPELIRRRAEGLL